MLEIILMNLQIIINHQWLGIKNLYFIILSNYHLVDTMGDGLNFEFG